MAKQPAGVWGIDLGQCALKAVRLEMIEGEVKATAFDYIEHPKILSQPDADADQLTREALEQFLSRNDLKGDEVVISVPGQSGLARFVKLPPVEEKKIDDIVRFEAKQQIPFPLEEVIWDYQKLGAGMVSDGYALETEIGLFAMKRDMIQRALHQFQDVNVEVNVVQMAPLALCNFVAYELLQQDVGGENAEEKPVGDCVVALDIGADNSNLVITNGGKIIWQRPIPLGGNHFTRALTKDLKLTFAKAEHLKRNAIKSPELKKILGALRPVLNDFVSEVQRSLGYFTNSHRTAQISYMIGLGNAFRLPGLQKFLQEKLQLEVRKLSNLERLQGDEVVKAPQFSENVLSFAVAYGLALQGLHLTKLQTNLLPQEIRQERMIREKKPWAVAAAAALLLAVAGYTLGQSAQWSAVNNKQVESAISLAKSVTGEVGKIESDYSTELKNAEESEIAVKAIASGVDERFQWNLVYKFINECLPQPNLQSPKVPVMTQRSVPAYQMYVTADAAQAYQKWLAKQDPDADKNSDKRDPVQEAKDAEYIKKHLVQINVEGIDCLYSENLEPYFDKVFKDTKEILPGMTFEEQKHVKEEKEKLPKQGWVFAIRGYVHHWDKEQFVINTLLENLRNPGARGVSIQINDEMKNKVIDKIGYFVLYRFEKIQNPAPGMLQVVKSSPLPGLLGMGGGAGGEGGGMFPGKGGGSTGGPGADGMPGGSGMGMGDGGGGGGTEAPVDAKRSSWTPLGEIAGTALSGGGAAGGMGPGGEGGEFPGGGGRPGGGGPGTPGLPGGGPGEGEGNPTFPNPMLEVEREPRTEFMILFVWQEPTKIGESEDAVAP